ncbi:hypothetical protein BZA70DRAFT_129005 [Myxozyma melibiosi]|uniref:Guanine nucleotide-exchange factor SEC12 n=1 Tax=Myxozyma melibiosi TaxID=54550 RepID=A0ABR1F8W0_9ASCO
MPDVFRSEVRFPIYAVSFATDSKLVVAGGGGEGKNGVANKIAVLDVDSNEGTITVAEEKILSKQEDAPMSLAISEAGVIAAGINSGSEEQKKGVNTHLRIFQLENNKVELQNKKQLFATGEQDNYQKAARFSSSAQYLAVTSSNGSLYSLTYPSLQNQFPPITETASDDDSGRDHEVQDVDYSPSEKYLAYTTLKRVVLLSASTGEKIAEYFPPPAASFRGVRFASHDTMILVANAARREGASIVKLVLPDDLELAKQQATAPVRTVRSLHSGIKAVTALDCRESLACVAGADLSVSIVRTDSLREIKIVQLAHSFPVTAISINPSCTAAASGSVAQSLVVINLEKMVERSDKRQTIMTVVTSLVVVTVVAVLVQLVLQHQVLLSGGKNESAGDERL